MCVVELGGGGTGFAPGTRQEKKQVLPAPQPPMPMAAFFVPNMGEPRHERESDLGPGRNGPECLWSVAPHAASLSFRRLPRCKDWEDLAASRQLSVRRRL
ncbi:unnamed protein product [Hapterophycus canaliculatus]